MNKRGLLPSVLVKLIAAVAAIIILLIFSGYLVDVMMGETDTQTCSTSVLKLLGVNKFSYGFATTTLNCKATHTDIQVKRDQREAGQQIVTKMTGCWGKMLGKRGQEVWDGLGDNNNACIVCDSFTVSEPIQISNIKEMLEIKEVKQYLKTDYPDRDGNQFFLSIAPQRLHREQVLVGLEEIKTLEPKTPYYVMYTYFDNDRLDSFKTILSKAGKYRNFPGMTYAHSSAFGTQHHFISLPNEYEALFGRPMIGQFHHTFVLPAEDAANLRKVCDLFYYKR